MPLAAPSWESFDPSKDVTPILLHQRYHSGLFKPNMCPTTIAHTKPECGFGVNGWIGKVGHSRRPDLELQVHSWRLALAPKCEVIVAHLDQTQGDFRFFP